MILVDPRAGSCELLKPLADLGLPVDEATLEFGDLCFSGRGERGAPLLVGIEHKKVSDLVQSLTSGRLQGHQLQGMLQTYDRPWLVIEGAWDHDAQGRATMWAGKGRKRPVKGAPPAVELEKRIITLETRGGLRVRHCPTRRDTLRFVMALYYFWSDKDLDQHKSHLAVHAPDIDNGLRLPMSDFRRAVQMLLPGIGFRASKMVEERCNGSWRHMMLWTEKDWSELLIPDDKGKERRLGAARAKHILEALK